MIKLPSLNRYSPTLGYDDSDSYPTMELDEHGDYLLLNDVIEFLTKVEPELREKIASELNEKCKEYKDRVLKECTDKMDAYAKKLEHMSDEFALEYEKHIVNDLKTENKRLKDEIAALKCAMGFKLPQRST